MLQKCFLTAATAVCFKYRKNIKVDAFSLHLQTACTMNHIINLTQIASTQINKRNAKKVMAMTAQHREDK